MKTKPTITTILLSQAEQWRAGAVELRNTFRIETQPIPQTVEMCAITMEGCALRLEKLINAYNLSEAKPTEPTEPANEDKNPNRP